MNLINRLTTALSDDKKQTDATSSTPARRPLEIFKSFSESARQHVERGLSEFRARTEDVILKTDIEALSNMSTLTKNVSKSSREEIQAKNGIKIKCKGFSFGYFTTCAGIHLNHIPLYKNKLCSHCVFSVNTGCVEHPGPRHGEVFDLGLYTMFKSFLQSYKSGKMSLDEYLGIAGRAIELKRLCDAHSTLKKLNLDKCPKGSIFKASTTRSQLYSDHVLASKSYGGSLKRVVNAFLKMNGDNITEFLAVAQLICYLPTPFNNVIDVLMHFYAETTKTLTISIAFTPAALRQVRHAFARDSDFPVEFNNHLIDLNSMSIERNCLVSVSPKDMLGCYIKTTMLSNYDVSNFDFQLHVISLADNEVAKPSFLLPTDEEVITKEYPTLKVAEEKRRMEKDEKIVKARARNQLVPKPAPVERRASKHKFYGLITLQVRNSVTSKSSVTKSFTVGKSGKWDLKSNAVGSDDIFKFIGRVDLLDPKNKPKKAKMLKSFIINAAKDEGFSENTNKLNTNPEVVFKTTNRFAGLQEVFSDVSGGGRGSGKPSNNNIKIYHTTVAKIGTAMVPKTERKSVPRNSGQWTDVSVPGDGNCFFWCLYYHGLPFSRATWKAEFDKHGVDYSFIAPVEFNDKEFVTGIDWIKAISEWLTKTKSIMNLNLIMYSPSAKIMHFITGYDRTPVINITYDMDTRNHYNFVFNTAMWKIELGDRPCQPTQILDYHGMKRAEHFQRACHNNNLFNQVSHGLEAQTVGWTKLFNVRLRNATIDFDFTDKHDLNRDFAQVWNDMRSASDEFKFIMRPAKIESIAADLKPAFATRENVCLGGHKERKEREAKQRDAFEKPEMGQPKVVKNKSGENASSEENEEENESEEIEEEIVVADLQPKYNFTSQAVEYIPSGRSAKWNRLKSVFSTHVMNDSIPTMVEEMIDGTYCYQYATSVAGYTELIQLLNLLKDGALPGAMGVTYGQVIAYCNLPLAHEDHPQFSQLCAILLKHTEFRNIADLNLNFEHIQGFTFGESNIVWDGTVEPFGSSGSPGAWIDTHTTAGAWLPWQKAKYSSACDYLSVLTSTLSNFFSQITVVGDMFKSVLDLFDEECVDKFRIHILTHHAAAVEIQQMFRDISTKRDKRSLRDLLTTIKRNPLICDIDISHYDVINSEIYLTWLQDYIKWFRTPGNSGPQPTMKSAQENTHINIIQFVSHLVPNIESKTMTSILISFMNFVNKFIYPVLVERVEHRKFSLSALAEFLSAPHIRNALRTVKNHSDMHVKLQHFSNNFGALNYDAVKDNFGDDIAGGTLYASAVFLKHLSYINMDLEEAVCANWHEGFRKFRGGGNTGPTRKLGYGVYCGDRHANHVVFRVNSIDDIWRKEMEDPHNLRTPVLVELPFSIGFHLPHMDASGDNLALGCTNRVTRYQLEYPAAFFVFMRKHIDHQFDNFVIHPMEPGALLTLEEYLAGTSYTEPQKNIIRGAWQKFCEEMKLEVNCSLFVKDESYDLFKAPRQIFSTTNMMKAICGPLVRTMEKCWFDQVDYHVKGLTNKQRLEKILQMFCGFGEKAYGMDFTSMESHLTSLTRKSQNYFTYRFYSNNLHVLNLLEIFFSSSDKKEGYTKDKQHIVEVLAKMCSGANETASFNLQFNKMVQDCCDYAWYCYNYYAQECAYYRRPFVEQDAMERWWKMDLFEEWAAEPCKMDHNVSSKLLLEGDDSLKIARIGFEEFAPKFFKQMGMEVKIDVFKDIHSASFCGIVASEAGDLLRDAVKTIIKMGSTGVRYMWSRESKLAALMKMKAECMLHDYHNCPILAAYCRRVISDIDVKYGKNLGERNEVTKMLKSEMSTWEWERFEYQMAHSGMETNIPLSTRNTYADVYGISVAQQMHLEYALATFGWDDIKSQFIGLIPLEAQLYTSRYVLDQPFARGCVAEVFVPESLRFILGADSHYEVYRRFIATNHDRNEEKHGILW